MMFRNCLFSFSVILFGLGSFSANASEHSKDKEHDFVGTYNLTRYTMCDSEFFQFSSFCPNPVKWSGVEIGDIKSFTITRNDSATHFAIEDRSGNKWNSASILCDDNSTLCLLSKANEELNFSIIIYTENGSRKIELNLNKYGAATLSVRLYSEDAGTSNIFTGFSFKNELTIPVTQLPRQIWTPVFSIDSSSNSKWFSALNGSRQTLLPDSKVKFLKASMHAAVKPMALVGDTLVEVPESTAALFRGTTRDEFYAVTSQTVYFKANNTTSWIKLANFGSSIANLRNPHFSLDPVNKVVAWVGLYNNSNEGLSRHQLVIWDLKNKTSTFADVGIGFDGMSSLMFLPTKKVIAIASMHKDMSLGFMTYDFKGKVVGDYPGINKYFEDGYFYRGMTSSWKWGVDLGLDSQTGELLVQYRHSTIGEGWWLDLAKAKIFRIDVDADKFIGEESP